MNLWTLLIMDPKQQTSFVEGRFNGDLVECLILNPEFWAQFPARVISIFHMLH